MELSVLAECAQFNHIDNICLYFNAFVLAGIHSIATRIDPGSVLLGKLPLLGIWYTGRCAFLLSMRTGQPVQQARKGACLYSKMLHWKRPRTVFHRP